MRAITPPRPIIQLFFLLILQHLLPIQVSVYQQKLLKLFKLLILQKQAIIEGTMDPPLPTRQCISEKHQLSMFIYHSCHCWENYTWVFTDKHTVNVLSRSSACVTHWQHTASVAGMFIIFITSRTILLNTKWMSLIGWFSILVVVSLIGWFSMSVVVKRHSLFTVALTFGE